MIYLDDNKVKHVRHELFRQDLDKYLFLDDKMKFVKNLIIITLLCITFTQWIAITFMLVGRTQSNKTLVSEEVVDSSSSLSSSGVRASISNNVLAPKPTMNKSSKNDNTSLKLDEKKEPNYDGVAVTLMINAPKWFQKRYATMISNILANTPPNWAIQIFYIERKGSLSKYGLDINPNLSRLNATHDRIIFTPIPQDLVAKHGEKKKLLYWTDEWLWKSLKSEKVLVFNGNGVICSNGKLSLLDGSVNDKLFKDLDYIGSPWRMMYGQGGDGSYSYRNRNAMLDVLRYKPYDVKYGREDAYFVSTLKEMNTQNEKEGKVGKSYRIATKEQTNLFAGNLESFVEDGDGPPQLPFVVSGTMSQLDHNVRQNVLAACPELGMMFPLLHHPSCFGASPNAKECAKHICALKDPSQRLGGC